MRQITAAASAALVSVAVLVSAMACDDGPVELPPEAPVYKFNTAVPEGNVHKEVSTTCAPLFGREPQRWRESVRWSSNGERILFSMGPDVYAVRVDGTGLQKVGDASVGGRAGPKTSFDVSPDGKRMVYSTCYPDIGQTLDRYEYELALVNLKDAETRQLTG